MARWGGAVRGGAGWCDSCFLDQDSGIVSLIMLLALLLPPLHAAEIFEDRAFYFGDLHVHTGASGDGWSSDTKGCSPNFPDCGALADVFTEARAVGLDFASVSEHVNNIYTAEAEYFSLLHNMSLDADDPAGGFVTIPAAELALSLGAGALLGHKNLYMFADNATLREMSIDDLRWDGESMVFESCEAGAAWFADWRATWGTGWLVPHHPATTGSPHPTDWSCVDDGLQPVVEMYSKHGNSLSSGTTYDLPVEGLDPARTVYEALDPAGYDVRVGFLSSTDDHHTRPGSTCTAIPGTSFAYGGGLAVAVLDASEPFERAAVGDAMGARRMYATSGPKLPVIIAYETSDGAPLGGMGEVIEVAEGESVNVEVRLPASAAALVVEVRLVGPSSVFLLQDRGDGVYGADGVPPEAWLHALVRLDGEGWWGDPCDDGGADAEERIWLSPTWFEVRAVEPVEDTGDTGDTASGGDSDPPDTEAPTVDSEDTEAPTAAEDTEAAEPEDPATPIPEAACSCGGRVAGDGSLGGAWWFAAVLLVGVRRSERSG